MKGLGMRIWKMNGNLSLAAALATILAVTAVLCGCNPDVVLNTGSRDFALDVPNAVFNATDETDVEDRGLGVTSITFTFGLTGGSGDVTQTVSSADLDTTWRYTRIPVTISGTLTSIKAAATGSAGDFTATIASEEDEDWDMTGWTAFGNLMKAKLDYVLDAATASSSTFRLLPCPRAGSTSVVYDSGVTAAADALTDRGTSLASGQIGLLISYAENPTDLEVDVYTAIVDVDFRDEYYTDIMANTYPNDPWTDEWTFEEITTTGRSILGKTYTLKRYNSDAWDAPDPMTDGLKSALIDVSDKDYVDQFLLVGIILRHGNLSAPMHVQCIPIY